jgi:hypothetical protein
MLAMLVGWLVLVVGVVVTIIGTVDSPTDPGTGKVERFDATLWVGIVIAAVGFALLMGALTLARRRSRAPGSMDVTAQLPRHD